MPRKSSIDVKASEDTITMEKTARKTERTHEENQERAYIAASRRADRSIEARVQSARMASDIHKKRTGKGFKITEEIVMKEEMYEEEDDDMPRSYRLLSANMQTASPEMNARLDAYLTNKMAMSAILARTNDEWRDNTINKLFAASFPNAASTAQQLTQNMPHNMQQTGPQVAQQAMYQSMPSPPLFQAAGESFAPGTYSPPSFSPSAFPPSPFQVPSTTAATSSSSPSYPLTPATTFSARPPSQNRRKSRAGVASGTARVRRNSSKVPSGMSKVTKVSGPAPTRQPSAVESSSETTLSSPTSVDEDIYSTGSAFTSHLPPEARMILDGVGTDAVSSETLAAQASFSDFFEAPSAFKGQPDTSMYNSAAWSPRKSSTDAGVSMEGESDYFENMPRYDDSVEFKNMANIFATGPGDAMSSKCPMPNIDDDWQLFVNEQAWSSEQ